MAGYAAFTGRKAAGQLIRLKYEDIRVGTELSKANLRPEHIQLLADDIRENGLLQPFFVRTVENGYELTAEPERFYAARLAECTEIPCIITEKGISRIAEMIVHSNLTFFEEAEAIEKLISYYGMTQEDAASQLGKAQSTIANKLRLLRLTEAERQLITENNLTERHARALLRISAPDERMFMLERVIKDGLNVEKTEQMVEGVIGGSRRREPYRKRNRTLQNVRSFVNALNKAVEGIQSTGAAVEAERIYKGDAIEYRIRIPYETERSMKSMGRKDYFS